VTEYRIGGPTVREINGRRILFDAEGFFEDPDDWSESAARELAREAGLAGMTEDHWHVLHFLRDYYYQNGRAPLNKQLKTGLGMRIRQVENLFPEGIKYGARRLAGLPNQPRFFPQRLEAGTLNMLGIMGLNAGLDYVEKIGFPENRDREMRLLSRLHQKLSAIEGVTVYGSFPDGRYVPVLSCNIANVQPHDVGTILDGDYGIAVRAGLHCAPLVHEDLGTSPHGAVRISLGWNTTETDIDRAVTAIADMGAAR